MLVNTVCKGSALLRSLIYCTAERLQSSTPIASVMSRLWLLTEGNRALRGKEVVLLFCVQCNVVFVVQIFKCWLQAHSHFTNHGYFHTSLLVVYINLQQMLLYFTPTHGVTDTASLLYSLHPHKHQSICRKTDNTILFFVQKCTRYQYMPSV